MLKFRELNEKFQDRVKNDYLIHGVKLTEFYKFIENVSFFEYPRLVKFFDYPRPLGNDDGMATVAVHGLYNDGENEYWFFEGVKDRVNGKFGLMNKVDFCDE